jgi:hypothetical protein
VDFPFNYQVSGNADPAQRFCRRQDYEALRAAQTVAQRRSASRAPRKRFGNDKIAAKSSDLVDENLNLIYQFRSIIYQAVPTHNKRSQQKHKGQTKDNFSVFLDRSYVCKT